MATPSGYSSADDDPGHSRPTNTMHPLNLVGASIIPEVATTTGRMNPAPSIELPNQEAEYIGHIALDIGGSLIKLIYFSPDPNESYVEPALPSPNGGAPPITPTGVNGSNGRGGRLHFVKFETSRVDDCIEFIKAKGLHRRNGEHGQTETRVVATGGGAYKYADVFKEQLGLVLEKEDEMGCLVAGCNFLRKAIHHEAFTYENGATGFVSNSEDCDLYPYLLVNIGSGVSMIKVTGDNTFERVSGSSLGGGTFWGLCRLLTGRRDFDEMLELSARGDNSSVDMLVGDIYGGRDYNSIGLAATTIASSFGKVVSQDREASDYDPADMALSLCRMVAYNIGQLAHLHAMRHGLQRIFFGGFFIRGHPYTMETISYAIRFWSKGSMAAMFLRHEGFLGAVGAFLKVHPMTPAMVTSAGGSAPRKVRAHFVERFSMGAPFAGGEIHGPAITDVAEKVSWVEKFVAVGQAGQLGQHHGGAGDAAVGQAAGQAVGHGLPTGRMSLDSSASLDGRRNASLPEQLGSSEASGGARLARLRSSSQGGVPPADGSQGGTPPGGGTTATSAASAGGTSTAFSSQSAGSSGTVTQVHHLHQQYGGSSSGGAGTLVSRTTSLSDPAMPMSPMSMSRDHAGRMSLHVGVLQYTPSLEPFPLLADPTRYEPNTLDLQGTEGELLWWLRLLEEHIPTVVDKACASEGGGDLARRRAQAFGRAFGAHISKLRLDPAAYGQLGLAELFEMREECLREFGFSDVYRQDKERENSAALQVLPDLLAEMDALPLAERLLATVEGVLAANIFDWGARACVALYRDGTILEIYRAARQRLASRPWAVDHFDDFRERVMQALEKDPSVPPFQRVMMFVDNAGADVVLGMLPFARELLRLGCEVVMVANSLPAINDITAPELRTVVSAAAQACPILRAARTAAIQAEQSCGGHVPPRSTPGPAAATSSLHRLAGHSTSHPPHLPSIPDVPVERSSSGSSSGGGALDADARTASTGPSGLDPESRTASAVPDVDAAAIAGEFESLGVSPQEAAASATALAAAAAAVAGATPLSGASPAFAPTDAEPAATAAAAAVAPPPADAAAIAAEFRSLGVSQSEAAASAAALAVAATAPPATAGAPPSADTAAIAAELVTLGVSAEEAAASSAALTQAATTAAAAAAVPKPSVPPAAAAVSAGGASSGGSAAAAGGGVPPPCAGGSAAPASGARLYLLANGQGSPCIDFRRVPNRLAEACAGVDLLVIEGMGRAIHTNFNARFKCDVLKLAMIKTERLAKMLFNGSQFDCCCIYDRVGTPADA